MSASLSLLPSSSPTWVVHKFGGTSLATAECYRNAAKLVLAQLLPSAGSDAEQLRVCCVVSAMGSVKAGSVGASPSPSPPPGTGHDKVTNQLISATALASRQDVRYKQLLADLKTRHVDTIVDLLAESSGSGAATARSEVLKALDQDFDDLAAILRSVWLSRTYETDHSWWFGFGELWSARLMSAYLNVVSQSDSKKPQGNYSTFLDAREVVFLGASNRGQEPIPDYETSKGKLSQWLNASGLNETASSSRIVVCTGYLASSATGTPCTLGRDGSDYSASIMAFLLSAKECTIWSDVDGVYSANPAAVREAVVLDTMSYDEASELAYFGAKILHPKCMTPLFKTSIPVRIRNTFNPCHPGTTIKATTVVKRRDMLNNPLKPNTPSPPPIPYDEDNNTNHTNGSECLTLGFGVRGFTEISSLCLLLVEGTGLVGVVGVCARLFGALREAGVSVTLITQAGSEHSICLAIPVSQGEAGRAALRREFRDEVDRGEISTIGLMDNVACLAVVGDGMSERPGTAARVFGALARAQINVIAIAQGSSERNISVIVRKDQVDTALRTVHQAFLTTHP